MYLWLSQLYGLVNMLYNQQFEWNLPDDDDILPVPVHYWHLIELISQILFEVLNGDLKTLMAKEYSRKIGVAL